MFWFIFLDTDKKPPTCPMYDYEILNGDILMENNITSWKECGTYSFSIEMSSYLLNLKLAFLGILCTNNPSCWYFTWVDTSYDGDLGPEWHNRCYLKDGKIEGFVGKNGMISGTKWCPGTKSPVHTV